MFRLESTLIDGASMCGRVLGLLAYVLIFIILFLPLLHIYI